MALAATTIWEVQTGGSDTANGAAFDPGQTAGMFTDGAATSATTSAPVFSSASYNFVAGDAGAWVYVASGTNWIPGWYKISSVASNVATLNATTGQGVLAPYPITPSTATGCATTGSPTGATWSIDYSQGTSARFTYTDLSSTGVGLTASSAAHPFGKQQVGNAIVVTGGTNFTTGYYVLASVAAGVGTFLGAANLHTGAGTDSNGTGGMGGAAASPGLVGGFIVGTNAMFVKAGTYSITTTTANTAGGRWAASASHLLTEGYQAVRGDRGTRPVLQASGISSTTLFSTTGSSQATNLEFDGASLTSIRGCSLNGGSGMRLRARNCTNSGIASSNTSVQLFQCDATGCTTTGAGLLGNSGNDIWVACEAYSNTVHGFFPSNGDYFIDCLSYGNTGATTDGFSQGSSDTFVNCVAYGNGRNGFLISTDCAMINCIAEANAGVGFKNGVIADNVQLFNSAAFNNTGGATSGPFIINTGFVTGSGSFFTNAAGNDFSLNNTSGAGASLRAAGYPGVFPSGTTTGFLDIGAAQHADPPAGGAPVAIFGG